MRLRLRLRLQYLDDAGMLGFKLVLDGCLRGAMVPLAGSCGEVEQAEVAVL